MRHTLASRTRAARGRLHSGGESFGSATCESRFTAGTTEGRPEARQRCAKLAYERCMSSMRADS